MGDHHEFRTSMHARIPRKSTLSRSFNELSIATIEKVRGTIIEKKRWGKGVESKGVEEEEE